MSSESYEDLGKCSILLDDIDELYLNSFCKGYRITEKRVYPLFLNYQLLGSLHKELISIEGNGFTRINLRQDRLLDIPLFIPPLSEQHKIVAYLDETTAKLDTLIQQKERKIELLKEKRTALINHVVTKGLDPNVEMKDSGVEWIGDIPSHWGKRKLSWSFEIGSGTTPKSGDDRFYKDGTINWLLTGDLNDDYINTTSKKITPKALSTYTALKIYEKGSIVVAMYGATIGKLGILNLDTTTNQACCVLSKSKVYIHKYIFYWLLSSRNEIINMGYGGGQPNISQDIVRNLWVTYPELDEQKQIVDYLDEQTKEIDDLIQLEQTKIELLIEYRQSLISEVVTGKIRVCEEDHSMMEQTA